MTDRYIGDDDTDDTEELSELLDNTTEFLDTGDDLTIVAPRGQPPWALLGSRVGDEATLTTSQERDGSDAGPSGSDARERWPRRIRRLVGRRVAITAVQFLAVAGAATAVWMTRTSADHDARVAVHFTQVSARRVHTCGLLTDARITCWGDNTYGEAEAPPGSFSQVAAGLSHSCGLTTDGTAICWEDDDSRRATPPEKTFTRITAGWLHSCGIGTDSRIACWGDNSHGQADPPDGTFTQVTTGEGHSCGLRTEGTVTCWGNNDYGQTESPTRIANPTELHAK